MARLRWTAVLGPGLLVAATGVGAGDLATAAFTGSELGVAVLWAVLVGAGLKFVLTEGLTRWQIATGQTLLEGALLRLGRPARLLFVLYLLPWSWFVGSALISASGVTLHALLPVFDDAAVGKAVFGVAASLLGAVLVERGGFALFERVMRVCIGVMFVTVVWTAVALAPDLGEVGRGLVWPSIPAAGGAGLGWTIALIGGVGGTLTILCYGYWIRESGRDGPEMLATCRADLAIGYATTAVFGLGMVVIGSGIAVDGRGSGLLIALGDRLAETLGPTARLVFLIGAFGAVFSSLLGTWQAVPFVFADFWRLVVRAGEPAPAVDPKSQPYRVYLWALALVPMAGLVLSFKDVQKAYALVGAAFLPLLAAVLLVLLGPRGPVERTRRNRIWTNALLVAAIALFALSGWLEVARAWG